jgi:Raf kinase inhibitor-like YbhB/YbcL family protein
MRIRLALPILFLVLLALATVRVRPSEAWDQQFRLTSTTIQNDTMVPSSLVFNSELGSICAGGNESPELSWTDPPRGTKSFVFVVFDKTAGFTHWGVYNIHLSTTQLAANAGSNASETTSFGDQIVNDAGLFGYTGPCPPSGLVHHYQFTVYALDVDHIDLHPSPAPFFADAETLYRAMFDHVLGSASITDPFSCPADSTPTATNPTPTGTCS